MIVALSVATLSATSVAFYGTFLFALCKESRRLGICYVVYVQTKSYECQMLEERDREEFIPRAA